MERKIQISVRIDIFSLKKQPISLLFKVKSQAPPQTLPRGRNVLRLGPPLTPPRERKWLRLAIRKVANAKAKAKGGK